jgi:DNA-binding MarR family transcriptional regulator
MISISDDQSEYAPLMPRSQASARTADAPGPPAVLAQRLGFLLKHVSQAHQSIQAPALAQLGLDGRLLAVLLVVDAEGPALQQRLSERLRVDRTTMVALIDTLEQSGLVERRRDPVDRRGYEVRITHKGAKILLEAINASRAAEQDFLAPLSAQEQRQLRALLGKLVLAGLDPGGAVSPAETRRMPS